MGNLHVEGGRFHGACLDQQRGLAGQRSEGSELERQMIRRGLEPLQIDGRRLHPMAYREARTGERTPQYPLRPVHVASRPARRTDALAPHESPLVAGVGGAVLDRPPGSDLRT